MEQLVETIEACRAQLAERKAAVAGQLAAIEQALGVSAPPARTGT